jgi:hypothetical protein
MGFLLLLVGACVVVRTRGPTAQTKCTNNLKQICLAVHDYASTYKNLLPPLSGAPMPANVAYPSSIFVELLPFIEEDNLYKAMMTSPNGRTWEALTHGGPAFSSAFVRTFYCPSDSSNSTTMPSANGWVGSSYAANALVFGNVADVVTDKQTKPQSWNVLSSSYNIGSIPDGTSNTIFIAERFALAGGTTPCAWADPPAGGAALGNPDIDAMGCPLVSFVSNKGPLRASLCGPALFFGTGTKSDPVGAIGAVPLYPLPEVGHSPPAAATDGRAQSQHTTVVQVAMGDGSARGVTSAVSQLTWVRAIDPNDAMPLGSDW